MKGMADVEFDADQVQAGLRPAYQAGYAPAGQHSGRRIALIVIIIVCMLVTFVVLLKQRDLVADKGIPVNVIERTPKFLPK